MPLRVNIHTKLLLLAGFAVSLWGCEQADEALTERYKRQNDAEINQYIDKNGLRDKIQQTDVGTYYMVTTSLPTAQTAATGDEVQYHFIARRLDGTIVDSTEIAANLPNKFIAGVYTGITAGLYDGIINSGTVKGKGLRKGEAATLLVPSYLDNGRVGTLLLPQYSPIRYDVRVVNIRTEDQQIEDYIAANKLTVTKKTDEGIRIAVTSAKPDSALAQTGQTASVLYKGKLLNGTQFDSRQDSTNAFSFKIGEGSVIKAWDIALPLVRKGETFILILPSTVGYGIAGSGSGTTAIPPYAPLVFEIRVLSSK